MERGGTSRGEAPASGPRSSSALLVAANSWITPLGGRTTARRYALASPASLAAVSSRPRRIGRCIAAKIASAGDTSATTAALSLSRQASPLVSFAAPSATMNGTALSGQCATPGAGTRLSKSQKELPAQNSGTAPAAISGCWSIGGSCSKSWAGRLAQRKTSTTSTANEMTTDPKTWSSGNARSPQVLELLITTARAANASRCRRANP